MHTRDNNNPVNTTNPPDNWAKLAKTRKNTIAGSIKSKISFIAKLVVNNSDFKDSGKRSPIKKAVRIMNISFAGKLKKNLLKFMNGHLN